MEIPIRPKPNHTPHQEDGDSTERSDIFQYDDLGKEESIRLLMLFSGKEDEPLVATIFTTTLSVAPRYEAVSYVWGDPNVTTMIQLNNMAFPITTNLEHALRRIRSTKKELILWVDQVCINQQRLDERGHQVALMGRVYKSAYRVYVCLGEDTRDIAKRAFDTLRELNKIFDERVITFGSKRAVPHLERNEFDSHKNVKLNAMCKIYNCIWFQRAWCVQEVSLARSALVTWGREEIKWSEIMRNQRWLRRIGTSVKQRYAMPLTASRFWESYDPKNRIHESKAAKMTFLEILSLARYRVKASDPRDFIYAFLGHPLASKTALGFAISPDYQVTHRQVFLSFATQWIICTGDPVILYFTTHQALPSRSRWQSLDYSSWCPQWDEKPSFFYNSGEMYIDKPWYRATLNESFSFKFLEGDLIVTGIIFDTIRMTHSPARRSVFVNQSASADIDVVQVTEEVLQDEEKYPLANGDSALQVLATVLNLGSKKEPGASRINEDFTSFAAYTLAVISSTERESQISEQVIQKLQAAALDSSSTAVSEYTSSLKIHCNEKRVFATNSGYLGIASDLIAPGDQVCVIFGCPTPFILRPRDNGGYIFVGAAYAHGIMMGEAVEMMQSGKLKIQDLTLK